MLQSWVPLMPLRRCFQQSNNLRPQIRTYASAKKRALIRAVADTENKEPVYGLRLRRDGVPMTDIISSNPRATWIRGKTNSTRNWRRPLYPHLWKGKPFKALTYPRKGHAIGGRNNTGRITMRHRGGGHKRRIRVVDFYRREPGKQVVQRIEYDPGRTAHIALLKHQVSNAYSYIVAAESLRAGDIVESFMQGIPQEMIDDMGGTIDAGILATKTVITGNCLPMHRIPIGTSIFNIGSKISGKAVFCRSSGTYAIVTRKNAIDDEQTEFESIEVQLASGEIRRISPYACATVGQASNPGWNKRTLGKAGRSRWLGIRPTVRGLAMNAADHPHGGGRGKSKGNRIPQSPWGQQAKSGFKTRRKRNKHIHLVKDRERNMGKRRAPKGTNN